MLGNKKIMGDNIVYYLEQGQIDRKHFAEIIGVPYSTLTNWVNGVTYPRIDKIQKMADYFGIEKSDLVEERKTKEEPLTEEELQVLSIFKTMNDDGKRRLLERAFEMQFVPMYQKEG